MPARCAASDTQATRLLDDGAGAALDCQNTRETENDVLFNVTTPLTRRAAASTLGEVQPLSLPVSLTPMYLGACGSGFSVAGSLSRDLK